jgi:hypothetical protein
MSLRDYINNTNTGFEFQNLDLNNELNFSNEIKINGNGIKIDSINHQQQENKLVYNVINKDITFSKISYGDFINTNSINLIADTPLSVPYTNAEINLNVNIDPLNPSRLIINDAGIYKIGSSIQFIKLGGGAVEIDIWFRKNGNDIPNSGSAINMSGGANSRNFSYVEIIDSFNNNDYIEIALGTSQADVSILSSAAQIVPFIRPSIPSIITTIYKLN